MTAYRPIKIPGRVGRPRRFRAILGPILFIVLLVGLSQAGFRHFAGRISIGVLKPFWAAGRGTGKIFTGLGGIFIGQLKLADENARLRLIIDQQSAALSNQTALKQENIVLRRIVNRAEETRPLAVGRLESRGQSFPLDAGIIDIGFQNAKTDIPVGTVATSEGSVALGELIEIYPTTAKMRLYSAAGERLSARLGETQIPIELIGRGGGNFIASLPRDLIISANDPATVIVAGREFVLAVVNNVKRAAGDSFQEIFLRVPINISQLTWIEMYAP